tara:strand:- start:21177 stop:21398 length:222 start_codon:yes stop_codon:yes gene_type:complete
MNTLMYDQNTTLSGFNGVKIKSWVIVTGNMQKGIALHGPFDTNKEALDYIADIPALEYGHQCELFPLIKKETE